MSPLLHGLKGDGPRLASLRPPAAMPGGEVELRGNGLQAADGVVLPQVTVGDVTATLALSRPARAVIRIPEGAISGDVVLARNGNASNPLVLRVAVPMAEGLNPVANPAVDADGNVYIAAGQIFIYKPDGTSLGTINVPERPIQLVFGGRDGRTLFILARTSLYSVPIKNR